jgi:flavin-dependent dehydrogenase
VVNERHKVIIVGGGPTGLATALALAKRAPDLAAQTLIIESKTYPRPKLCGGGITVHGAALLHSLGLDDLDITAYDVHRLEFHLGDYCFSIEHPNVMRVVERSEFDAAIADAVAAHGIPMHTGERVLDIQAQHDDVILTTDQNTYHADVVIAADGANSTIRRKLGMFSSMGVARLLKVVRTVQPDQERLWQDHTAIFDFSCVLQGVQGYMWDFPCYAGDDPCMNYGIFDSRIAPDAPNQQNQAHGHFKQTFAEGLHARDINLDDLTLKGHPVRWFHPQAEFSRPRILLAGDAAGVDPLFAEGISYGMQYSEIVVGTLQDAFARGDFSFTDYRSRLLSHQLGKLLMRRTWVADSLYRYRHPWFWRMMWGGANIASKPIQRRFGAYLALLPN